jgi:Iron-containing redox enzyme
MPQDDLVERLDAKNRELIRQIEESEFCRRFFAPETTTEMLEAMTAGLLHQVSCYGHQLTRSVSTALGRLAAYPQFEDTVPKLMKSLLGEVTHAEMARKDSVQLKGESRSGPDEKPSPAAFAVAAVARLLCEDRHPLTHLGFFYLLEGTTSQMAPRLHEVLTARGIQSPFLKLHAEEDVQHASELADRIREIVAIDRTAAEEIEYGYDCFVVAYPLPVWVAGLERALAKS